MEKCLHLDSKDFIKMLRNFRRKINAIVESERCRLLPVPKAFVFN